VNIAVRDAALRAGCTKRQAETLAVYVESEKIAVAALTLGITTHTAQDHLSRIYTRLDVSHAAAAVARLLDIPVIPEKRMDPRVSALR
jgi:DNA-binding CsgD family transcriptional regulator